MYSIWWRTWDCSSAWPVFEHSLHQLQVGWTMTSYLMSLWLLPIVNLYTNIFPIRLLRCLNEIMHEKCLIPFIICTYYILHQSNISWPPCGGKEGNPYIFLHIKQHFLDSRAWFHWRQFISIVLKGKKYHTFVLLVLVSLLFAQGAFILKKISLKRYCALNNVKESQTFYRKLISEINLERKILPCPSNNMSGTSFTYKDDHLKWTGMYALEYHFTHFFSLCYTWKSDRESICLKSLLRHGNYPLNPSTTNITPKSKTKEK